MRYAPKHTFGRYHFYTILCPSCLAGAPLVPMHIYLQLSGYGVQSLSKARTLRMYRRHAYAPACSCQMSAGSHMWAPPCIRVCKYCGMLAESVRSPRMCTSAPCRNHPQPSQEPSEMLAINMHSPHAGTCEPCRNHPEPSQEPSGMLANNMHSPHAGTSEPFRNHPEPSQEPSESEGSLSQNTHCQQTHRLLYIILNKSWGGHREAPPAPI